MQSHRERLHRERLAIHEKRTVGQTIADGVATVFAAWPYVITQLTVTAIWIACNTGHWFPYHWDEPPYIKLNLVYSFIAGFATSFILMAANRQAMRDRQMAVADDALLRDDHTVLTTIHTLTLGQNGILKQQGELLALVHSHIAGDAERMTVAAPTMPMEAIPLPPARPAGSLHVSGPNGELPDPVGTPGAVNTDVTPATLATTIGAPNWTAGIRPPVSFTNALKVQQMTEYGLTGDPSEYEEDHLVPLECGGAPHDPMNLWPQRREGPWGARVKDLTENAARAAILSGAMTLADVQAGFKSDWTALHTKLLANVTPEMAVHLMMMEPPEDEP